MSTVDFEQVRRVRNALYEEMYDLEQKCAIADEAARRVNNEVTKARADELSIQLKEAAERYNTVATLHRGLYNCRTKLIGAVWFSILMTALALIGALR